MEILDVDIAVGRPGRTPEQWERARFGAPSRPNGTAAEPGTSDDPAAPRPRETWLRFALPSGMHGFHLGLRHLPQQVWIDDVEVTVSLDAGTIALEHPLDRAAVLTIRCLRSLTDQGIDALTTPLTVH